MAEKYQPRTLVGARGTIADSVHFLNFISVNELTPLSVLAKDRSAAETHIPDSSTGGRLACWTRDDRAGRI